MKNFGRYLARVEDILHYAGCLALLTVAVLLNADILSRLVFGIPVQIQFEMTELYLMPALACLSLSRVFRDGGHLALDIVPEGGAGSPWRFVRIGRMLLAAAFFAVVTWMSGQFAFRAFARGEIEFGVIDWPLGWAYLTVPLGCCVLMVRLVYETIREGGLNTSA
ncbi:TRAP transporter small permease [Roseibium sp. Sym1]|uniref:TRAP transporter small permease n=1 Tax=Roseibium sp. Sym1 TaxID=3016006 RepID=UPI0022B54371|nr:TRAP transporter small permease [Roseibium sp. Sym1]